jgi:hypothetical protein
MNKFTQFLNRLLINRYGQDALNITLLFLSFLFSLLSLIDFPLSFLFSFISFVCLTLSLLRFFSKNITKRRLENQSFIIQVTPITRYFKLIMNNFNDRHRKYFLCPMCKKMVRVPRRKGRVEITCPTCHHHFKRHT